MFAVLSMQRLSIGVPRVPGDVVSRPRLTRLIEGGGALTVVRAACGAGKTVAVHEWARSAEVDVLWLTVEEREASTDALAGALWRLLGQAGYASPETTGGEPGWSGLRAALGALQRPLALVVDDAAWLAHEAVLDLCRTVVASERVRVIALVNRRTVLDSEGVSLLLDRTLIEPADLMFDDDEIERALGVDASTARQIREATSGFAAVIHAVAKRGVPDGEDSILDAAVEAVEEYMRIRVARSGYEPALLRGLMRVSIAEEVDVTLARQLADDPEAVRYLDEAEGFGFGAWTSGRGDRVFRFSPFARQLLRRELERLAADELSRLRQLAADWAVRHGAPLDALRIAVQDGDLALARRVVMMSWQRLLTYDGAGVRELLGPIPLPRLRREPLLVMLLAICYNASRVRRLRGLQLFRVAVSAANSPAPDMSPVERLFIWAAESSALRVLGMHDRAGTVAVRALRVLAELSEEDREPYAHELPAVCAQLGISLYYGGHRRRALECFAYGAALAESGGREGALSSLSMLAGIHALNGDMPEARHYVELIRAGVWPHGQLNGYQGTFYRVAEALLALEDSDLEAARRHVAVFEPHRATSEHWITMAIVEASVELRSGRPTAALTRLDSFVELRGREAHTAVTKRELSRIRALANLAAGNARVAKTILHKDGDEDRFETVLERARVALIENRPGDTLRMLGQGRVRPDTARLRAAASVLRTAALLRSAGPAAARREAESLGSLLCDRQLRMPLATLSPSDLEAVLTLLAESAPCEIGPVTSALPDAGSVPKLTERERIVLRTLMSTSSLTEVSDELGVSPNTVKTQLRSVYRKLGVTGREEAVAIAVSRNLLAEDA